MLKKYTLRSFILLFLVINIAAFFHAYKFTHFSAYTTERTRNARKLSAAEKIKTLIFGVNNPKPLNTEFPLQAYKTIYLQSSKKIECWEIKTPDSKGTVAIFHGYAASKSMMLDKADEFIKLGYGVLLVDFIGCGGSEGNQTTIGFKEAQDVKTCFDYLKQQKENNIILFGTSMGAAAIMKSIDQYHIHPSAIILECPFGSMYKTTCARFKLMHVPSFPMAGILLFYGGLQNNFWAFSHNPQQYAKTINCPTLLLQGGKDAEVSRSETDEIYKNLGGKKTLKIYPNATHENYLIQYKNEWINDVGAFLSDVKS